MAGLENEVEKSSAPNHEPNIPPPDPVSGGGSAPSPSGSSGVPSPSEVLSSEMLPDSPGSSDVNEAYAE